MYCHSRQLKEPPLSSLHLFQLLFYLIYIKQCYFSLSKHMYISCLETNSHRVKSTLIVPSIKISNSPGNFICATAGQNGAFE